MSSDGGGSAPVMGGIFSAGGSLMEASDKASAYSDQAAQLQRNAQMERKIGAYNAMREQIGANRKFGAIEANSAASGVAADSGSTMAVLASSTMNSEFDRLSILHGSDMRAGIMEERARYDSSAADRTRQLGYFNAFASLFGAGAKAGSMAGPSGDGGDAETQNDFRSTNGGGYGSSGGGYGGGGYGRDWESA